MSDINEGGRKAYPIHLDSPEYTVMISDYIPAIVAPRVCKATAKKRETWNRLSANPDALPAMLGILRLEGQRYHALRHAEGARFTGCDVACTLRDDREIADVLYATLCHLTDDAVRNWCLRFGVTIGYWKRFRSHAIYSDTQSANRIGICAP